MAEQINIGGANQVPLTNAAVEDYMVGASYFNMQPADITAVNSAQPGALSHFIPYPIYTRHSFDAVSFLLSSGTLDTEFGIYAYDPTGLKLGAKLAGGTTGATPTLNLFTELTFTAVTMEKGHVWLGFSGVGANATLPYGYVTDASINKDSGFIGFGIDTAGTSLSSFFAHFGFYTAANRIAGISPGDALTPKVSAGTVTPFLGLRAA